MTGEFPSSVAVGDFNGDGILDLAVANYEYSETGSVTVLLGNGDGTFSPTASNPSAGEGAISIAVGDFNGDGIPDLAIANFRSYTITILLGSGDGSFTATASSLGTGEYPSYVAIGDFNGDGIPDLAVANSGDSSVKIFLGKGDGTFKSISPVSKTGADPVSIGVGDFNGDGVLDLAVLSGNRNSQVSDTVTILLGYGDGTFRAAASSPEAGLYSTSMAVADLNGDGILDLAIVNLRGNSATVLLGNGDGTFSPTASSPSAGSAPISIAVGDFNGDGIPDLAVVNNDTDSVTILLGNGDGTFSPTAYKPLTGDRPNFIATGDLTGSGISDLAVPNWFSNSVTVLLAATHIATATATGVAEPIATGSHQVIASYSGDSNYGASISNPIVLASAQATPTVSLAFSANPGTYGVGVNLSATVTGVGSTPTGTVHFYGGGSLLGSGAISDGVANLLYAGLSLGQHSITAEYSGDTNYVFTTSPAYGLTINQGTPAITWATPTAITYGTALGVTQLDASSPVAGTFAYTPTAGTVLGPGSHTLSVTFTPTDTTDYTTAKASVTLTVDEATPTITWATPAAITYGTALSGTQLDASSTVAGTFSYSPVAGTVLSGGSQTLSVTFTPTDAMDYTTAKASVALTVNKATPAVTWATPAAITYGTPLSPTQLDASSTVKGTFAYSPKAGAVPGGGSQTLSVTFTPTDATDYTTAKASVTVTVNKATPAITWAAPAAITYGTELSADQLDATSTLSGTFSYTPTLGTVLKAGSQTLSVTFTPADATDYKTATKSVTVTVNKATPTIHWATPAAISYGTALGVAQLDASATGVGSYANSPVGGSFAYSPAAGEVLQAGVHTLSVNFTPTDSADYATAKGQVTLTVNKTTPKIDWAAPAPITYGTALGAAQLNATSPVAGVFAYSPEAGTLLKAGAQTLGVTFTPTDTANYTMTTDAVSLTVKQAAPAIKWDTPAAITYGTPVGATQLNATSSSKWEVLFL